MIHLLQLNVNMSLNIEEALLSAIVKSLYFKSKFGYSDVFYETKLGLFTIVL